MEIVELETNLVAVVQTREPLVEQEAIALEEDKLYIATGWVLYLVSIKGYLVLSKTQHHYFCFEH